MADFESLMKKCSGNWKGISSLWLDPTQPPESTNVEGTIQSWHGTKLFRHTYSGIAGGKEHVGEETVAYNRIDEKVETWFLDQFHMNYAVMNSEGKLLDDGFNVVGSYQVGKEHPDWSWRTIWKLASADELKITSYNISPEGEEHIAIAVQYERVKS